MATRQRLRAVLDARRASRPCLRCALNLPRHSSTSPAGIQESSMGTNITLYDHILPQRPDGKLKTIMPQTQLSYPENATTALGASEGGSSGMVHRPTTSHTATEDPSSPSPAQSQSNPGQAVPTSHPQRTMKGQGRTRTLAARLISDESVDDVHLSTSIPQSTVEDPQSDPADVVREARTQRTRQAKGRPSGVAASVPRKVIQKKRMRPRIRMIETLTLRPYLTTPVEPRIRVATNGQSVALPVRLESESTPTIRKHRQKPYQPKNRRCIESVENSVVRFHSSHARLYTLYVADRDGNTGLTCKDGPSLDDRPKDAIKVSSKGQREVEISDGDLTSVLNEFMDSTSNLSNITKTGKSRSSPSSSFQFSRSSPPHYARPPALIRSPTSNSHSPRSSEMLSSTGGRAAQRHYATAASQTLQAAAPIDPPVVGTNPAGLVKGRPRRIREALELWQQQHDSGLADTSGRPPSSMLSDTQNLLTQSGEDNTFNTIVRDDEVDNDDDIGIESEERTPDIFANEVFLRRGDLVEVVAASEPVLAIFIRNVADQCQFYTIRGEWVNRDPGGARWGVSQFVDPDDLNEILPYLPAEEVAEEKMDRLHPIDVHAPRGAGAKVIEQMSLFHRATDAVFRQHAERINRLYDIIAPSEEFADRTNMSLKDIAMKVLMKEDPSELTQPMLWAIHRAIAQSQNIIWDQMNYRQNPRYEVYPRQGMKYIDQVRDWVREYQEEITQEKTNESMFSIDPALIESTRSPNPIATLVQKARVAIKQSRQTRPLSKSGFIGPSSIKIDVKENKGKPFRELKKQIFDDNEKIIIHYLDVWTTSAYINTYTNLGSLGPMILRATGMYEGFELDRSRGFTLLQELGVITPWENRTVYKLRNLKLPGYDDGFGEASRMLSDASIEAQNFEPKDSMEGLRKDWGNMPVFCIDSSETLEHDDGVSLELVESDPSVYWVHIHVANPSAFINPNSAGAKYAASLAESVYFPERKHPMLDPKVTRDRLGLANDRPCITFSAKMSADGDILEKKITPGIVRNVLYFTPQAVRQGLGLTPIDAESHSMSILTVGGCMPDQLIDKLNLTSKALIDTEHIEVLRTLLKLGEAAYQKRVQAGAPDFHSSDSLARTQPKVWLGKDEGGKYSQIQNRNVRQFEGDPIISLQASTESYGLVANMVANLMVIAGHVGASWCSERNIPIPYRGILRNPEPASSPEVFKREVLDPKIAKYGCAELIDLRRYMRLIGQTQASDRPLHHFTLGLPAYCKATSPLRRYTDLYAHWQMEAAIRHEAATGTSLVGGGSTDDSYLPFSRVQVRAYVETATLQERKISLAQSSASRHWICQALFRAFHFREAALPETFEARVTHGRIVNGFHAGWWDLWNVRVRLMYSAAVSEEGGFRIGDVWETRLMSVDPYYLYIIMEPIRLLEKGEEA